jgi:7-cyano-7-deazaguanine synthase
MTAQLAVVLLSGGLDSATCLAIARAEGFTPLALSFRYGQRHTVELERAAAIAAAAGVEHHVVDIEVPKHDEVEAAVAEAAGGTGGHDVPVTYVPARNTIFLSFALGLAEVRGAADVYIGVNAVDYSGYPDCRPEFVAAFEEMANLATRAGVEGRRLTIHTPLIALTKADIIRWGTDLGVDYATTSTCYDPAPDAGACGRCDACLLRARGFADAGIPDPTIYAGGAR